MGLSRPAGVLVALALVAGCSGGTPSARPSLSPSASPTPGATARPTTSPTAGPTASPSRSSRPSATPSRSSSPSYPWSVRRVTAADLPHSWRPGCPVGPSQLRMLTLRYVGFDGARHTGHLVVNAKVVGAMVSAFRTLDAQRFPIRSLRPVDDFGGSDDASMAADNTSAFNCRQAVGGSGWSMHAYGLAIDVDPRENPYLQGGTVMPPEGAAYVDRSDVRPGMAVRGGTLVRAFSAVGWEWGGSWSGTPDYQHFSSNGR